MLKRYKDFINESKEWIYEGDFTVTKEMIKDGHFIEGMIPDIITGYFNCSNNKLTSLKGGPDKVGGYFDCYNNKLTSLEGGPVKVRESFYCKNNKLTSLEGAPDKVGGYFDCSSNRLTSLKGGPDKVGESFLCHNNMLTSLEEGPVKVGISFYCDNNKKDLSLEKAFIESNSYNDDYFVDLLGWIVSTNRDTEDAKSWPKGFLDSNVGQSAKNIGKFKL